MSGLIVHHTQAPLLRRSRAGQRRGVSLIELMATLMIGSVIAGLATTLMISLLGTEQASRQHALETRTLERLARRFRTDAHSCSQLDLNAAAAASSGLKPICQLARPDGAEINYFQQHRAVVRRESRAGQLVRQETYRFPGNLQVRVERQAATGGEFAALVLAETDTAQARGDRSSRRQWQVEAELGRDQRLAQAWPIGEVAEEATP